MKVSNYKTILAGAAAACLFWISAYGKAQASWTTQIEEFGNSSFAGPYETVEIFITSDPGGAGPFQSDGITFETSFPNTPGWSTETPNPFYSIASGPAHDGGFDISFLFDGNINNTIGLNMIIWDGAIGGEIHFATSFQYADGALEGLGEDFGAGPHSFLLHPDGIGYDRSSQVPEPSSSVAVAIALIGFVLRRHPRALRNEDDWRRETSSAPVYC